MQTATLIFPHQLFKQHPALNKKHIILLAEDPTFFKKYPFHKQKLILHRASMQAYKDFLEHNDYVVAYLPSSQLEHTQDIFAYLADKKITTVHCVDTVDHDLEAAIKHASSHYAITLKQYESPMFLTPADLITSYFGKKTHFRMAPFYQMQRKRLKILITKDNKPTGGQWSFDEENRRPLPVNLSIPPLPSNKKSKYVTEAKAYVEKYFGNNYGSAEHFMYPVTFDDAQRWLDDFLNKRLNNFGPYQDAINDANSFLFHSLLTAPLNIGLITPDYVLEKTLSHAAKNNVPINSLEGFIRQIIGWREFVRATYLIYGNKQKKANFWQHTRTLSQSFWHGNTGIEPVDNTIKKVLQYAYCNHIERLMVLGNIMLLLETHPTHVNDWFMSMFIDAYDWVMIPNVYGMSQYADGGSMVTKPYISGSHYVLQMSNFKRGTWCPVWDALYWNFIATHKQFFLNNPRLALAAKALARMSEEKKATLRTAFNTFFAHHCNDS